MTFFDGMSFEDIEHRFDLARGILSLVTERPRMLPGESETEYDDMFEALAVWVDPQGGPEWLVMVDLAYLFWEMRRYRRWKDAILCSGNLDGLKAILRKTNLGRMIQNSEAAVRGQAELEAEEWRTNPEQRLAINLRLKSLGYNEEDITAAAFVESLPSLAAIERFLTSTRQQVNELLRNVRISHEFKDRALLAIKKERHLKLAQTNEARTTAAAASGEPS